MKKYVEVFWSPYSKNAAVMQNLFVEPKPLFSIINKERKGAGYLKCPAFQELVKNEFVITAPFDLNVTIKEEERGVYTDRYGQDFYNLFIINRGEKAPPENPYMLSLPPYYVFYSKDNVSIETRDTSLLTSGSSSNLKVIPGGFNISKWVRPIEFAIEVIDVAKPIEMRVGDPLFSIRFITPNNVPVKLTRVEESQHVLNMVDSCVYVKSFMPNLKLHKLYEMASSYLSVMLKR